MADVSNSDAGEGSSIASNWELCPDSAVFVVTAYLVFPHHRKWHLAFNYGHDYDPNAVFALPLLS